MSLLLFNQLTATLSVDNVSVTSQSRGLGRHAQEQRQITVAQLTNEQTWQPAVNQFESLLASMHVKIKAHLKVIVSSHFVRYLVLPAQLIAMSKQEKLAYATAAYREVYGAAVDSWHIKLQDAAPNQPMIAVAMDERLLAALRQASVKYQLKLTSVQPNLMSTFNAISNQLSNINGYLVILESGRLLLASLLNGKCQQLRSIAIGDNWQDELKHLLMRESVMGDAKGKEVLIQAADQKIIKLMKIDGWNIRHISHLKSNKFSPAKFALQRASA